MKKIKIKKTVSTIMQNRVINKIRDIAPEYNCFLYTVNIGVLYGNIGKYAVCISVGENTEIGKIIVDRMIDYGVYYSKVDSVEEFITFVGMVGK